MNQYSDVVSVTKASTYDKEEIKNAVKRHFELLRLDEIIKPNMRVLLKPNLLMKRKPEEITTTHPSVIYGIISCLKELRVSDITIADSPGGPYTKQALSGIYEASGMKALAKECNVKLNYDFSVFDCKNENGVMTKSFTLITPIKEADFIIDIAKLKTHSMTTLSGGVKNLFGTVPGLMKPEFHWRFPDIDNFCNMLLDLCETVKPDVTFVDAVISMQGDGPSGGTPYDTGLIFASRSPYSVDIALCKAIDIDTNKVPTVYNAMKRNLCVDSFDKLTILGDKIHPVSNYQMPKGKSIDFIDSAPSYLKKILEPLIKKFVTSKPVIRTKGCIGCGKCAESCPANTIQIVNRKAVIDYSKCIKCFCCHEMCPVKTIDIKRFWMFNYKNK